MRRRPPIRDEIRHAAEHGEPLILTAEEVQALDEELETTVSALEMRWAEKESEA